MINIQPIQVFPSAVKVKINNFYASEYPIIDNVFIVNVAFMDEDENVLRIDSVPFTQDEYDNWGIGEDGEEYLLNVCINKLNIEKI